MRRFFRCQRATQARCGSARHRQRHAHRHEHAAADLIELAPGALQQRADAVRQQRQQPFDEDFHGDKNGGHQDELRQQIAGGIDKLRQKGAVEQQRLRVRDGGQQPLPEHRTAARLCSGRVRCHHHRRRAPELDAQPDQISATDQFEHNQRMRRGLQQRTNPRHRQRNQQQKAQRAAPHREPGAAVAVDRSVGQHQQAVRPGRDREPDRGDEVQQPGMPDMRMLTYFMPVMFMFIMNSFPAGLSFYYLVSNVVTILQQQVIRRFVNDDKIRKILEENRKKIASGEKKKSKFSDILERSMRAAEDAKKQAEDAKKQVEAKKQAKKK